MRETLRAFQQIARIDGVEGAALVGVQNHVLSERLDGEADALENAVASLRLLFRATEPAVRSLDLRFQGGRLLVIPVGGSLLVLRASLSTDLGVVLERSDAQASVLGRFGQENTEVPEAAGSLLPLAPLPEELPAPEGTALAGAALQGLARVIEAARKVLGGPVLRNYLRRTQQELAARWPWLATLQVDLNAAVSGVVEGQPEAGLALGCWAQRVLARASTVVPELGKLDVDSITEDLREPLRRSGFYEGLRTQGELR
ncbi:MAG: hypothetical protein MUF64_01550 [Polyangiaceae bacterium]|nr:hypothetical protein [Polyangiaceae bacterium]